MNFKNEEELKQKMGIESWRNLSREKFLTFVSELPNMSKEVAIKVVEQFPDFKSLVLDSLDHVHEQATGAVAINWKSQRKVHKAFAEYRGILGRELDRDGLTSEDRFRILGMLREAIEKEALKDSEHKAFVYKVVTTVAGLALAGAAAAATILGGNVRMGGGDPKDT